jgi:hypothetical protein
LKKIIKNLKNAILNISSILKIKIIKQVKIDRFVLPKHVLVFKLVEKYTSYGPRAKIVVVNGAILNYSAIL